MKKLTIKQMAEHTPLTKEQMKKVIGGEISGCGWTDGGQFIGFLDCSDNVCVCQSAYDSLCEQSDTCDDIDCGCK